MKVIVTGGAGFIGSHLVDQLIKDGYEVTVIDNLSTGRIENLSHVIDKIKFIEADISKKGFWQKSFEGGDWVFHLAALADIVPSIEAPDEYFSSNVLGTFNVLESANKFRIKKFIYSASSSCYGSPEIFPTPENSKIDPQYPYALTKRLGEELVMHWAKVYGVSAISLRFFNVYGPKSRTSGTYGAVFGVFLAQKLAKVPYTVVGDGEQTRDFTYVSDVVSAVLAAARSPVNNQIYNVGSGKTVSINRLVDLLGGISTHIPKRPGEPSSTHADISKIKAELNWTPTIPIEKGVIEILKHINYWKDAPYGHRRK